MVGVLLVIGGLIVTAMFFVLYVRAVSAERRADMLSAELEALREERKLL
ncbi:MAG: hypothetical protein Q7S99_17500 [Parvibaculum sp.]|nr:hypothetical protein [Parvibaculum sp.]